MRLLYVNQDRGTAPDRKKGAAVHVRAMREAFRGLGVEVLALDESDPAQLERELEQAGSLDVIYERHALATSLPARFARKNQIPYVLEINAPLGDEEDRWRSGASTAARAAERENVACARLVLCVSRAVAHYARGLGADDARIAIKPNGVDTNRFRPRTANDALRAELVPEGRIALGFHGRLRPWHGIDRMLEAAREGLARGLDLHVVFVGVGGEAPELREYPADRLTVVPWVEHDEVARYVSAFDVLPLSHPPELPFYFSPLKLAEAMASGVVPIVPRLGDLPELVRDGWSGRVYDPMEASALARAIEDVARDHETREEMAHQARAAALDHSWESIARFVLERSKPRPKELA